MLNENVIEGFVGSCLLKGFDGSLQIPDCHRDWWKLCTGPNKFVAIAAPRGHAKSTAITLSYTLACVLFRERSFVLVVSDTETQACLFLGQIKAELQNNDLIINTFKVKRNDKGEVQFLKDSESDVIIEFEDGHRVRIMAKGSEQKLRGLLWNGKRPDLIVCDDLENDEIVMNKDRREKFKRWFNGALLPCRSANGIIRIVGTILHMDSMLENLMPKDNSKDTVVEDLKMYGQRRIGAWTSIKYRAHTDDFEKILWPAKWSAEGLKAERASYIHQGLGDVYSQEYLNIPLDEANAYFKKNDFIPLSLEDKKRKLNYYIAADLAISEKERADYSAFVVGGIDEAGILQIRNIIRERMDGQAIVETMLSLQRLYEPVAFGVEETQISKAIGPFLRESMLKSNTYISLVQLKPNRQDKQMRAKSIQARMRAGAVKFDKAGDWYDTLESEMLRFPRDKHDDQVDSMAYLGLMIDNFIEAPTKEEEEEDEYLREMQESGMNDSGRSNITGY